MSVVAQHRWRIFAVVVVLAVIVGGKHYYRAATADDLRWILAPTAQLVSWTTGGDFAYEAGPGWVDPRIGFIIAPPCAGVNFALAAFLALSLGGVMSMTTLRTTSVRLITAAAAAYVATLVINTIRISIAVAMHRGTLDLGGMDRAEAHRIEGIVVYLIGLVGLYAIARNASVRRLGWLAVPIVAYLAITLALPALNGAVSRADFARHAATVIGACLALTLVLLGVRTAMTHSRRIS